MEKNHNNIISGVLKKNKISKTSQIIRYTGGQINFVYKIGSEFVLKIEKDLNVTPHQVSLVKLAVDAGAKVPKILDSGEIEDKCYILMEHIKGDKLSKYWHTFDEVQKEDFIRQICEQMKIFHSIKFEKYSPQRPHEFNSFLDAIEWQMNQVSINEVGLDELTKKNLALIKRFYENNKSIFNESSEPVFVHNDLHFENILFNNNEITGIIDFDFGRQFPKDFELRCVADFFFSPKYYVEEGLEQVWKEFNLGNELIWFKKYYPELFCASKLPIRLKLYLLNQMLCDLRDGATYKLNERVEAYFESDWLERHIG